MGALICPGLNVAYSQSSGEHQLRSLLAAIHDRGTHIRWSSSTQHIGEAMSMPSPRGFMTVYEGPLGLIKARPISIAIWRQ